MMKKILLSIAMSALCVPAFTAGPPQSDGRDIGVRNIEVVRTDNTTVRVAFRIVLGPGVTSLNRSLVIVPHLQGEGGQRSALPPIIVRGVRARASLENQAMSVAGVDVRGRYVTTNGQTLDYQSSIPWQGWMKGSQLMLSGLNAGRGTSTEVEIGMVADRLLAGPVAPAPDYAEVLPEPVAEPYSELLTELFPEPLTEPLPAPAPAPAPLAAPGHTHDYAPVSAPAPVETARQRFAPTYEVSERPHVIATIGEELAARFTFVEPVARFNQAYRSSRIDEAFNYDMPLIFNTATTQDDGEIDRFIEMTRQGAIYVRFEKGDYRINRDLGDNNQRLVDLISSIRVLDTSPQTRVVKVVVVGFSAPEGALDEKETLAMQRAEVIRDFLTANSRVDPAIVGTYNGSVDWTTLRMLVAGSNMPQKYKVLDIIDNVPAWGNPRHQGRMDQLIALNDGEEFRYMRELFFPQLRQTGAYIKVYYENVR